MVGQASSLSVGAHGRAPFVEDRQDAGPHCKPGPDTDPGMPVATKSSFFSRLLLRTPIESGSLYHHQMMSMVGPGSQLSARTLLRIASAPLCSSASANCAPVSGLASGAQNVSRSIGLPSG
jgi:hypothetical protein